MTLYILCNDYVLCEGVLASRAAQYWDVDVKLLQVALSGPSGKRRVGMRRQLRSIFWAITKKLDSFIWGVDLSKFRRVEAGLLAAELRLQVVQCRGKRVGRNGMAISCEGANIRDEDVIVRAIPDIISGEILAYRIFSIHGGGSVGFRGGPSSFWEVYERKGYTSVFIQQLSGRLDAGSSLAEFAIPTGRSFSHNLRNVYAAAISELLYQIAIYVGAAQETCTVEREAVQHLICGKSGLDRPRVVPTVLVSLHYLWLTTRARVGSALSSLLGRAQAVLAIGRKSGPASWRVQLSDGDSRIRLSDIRSGFVADPFFFHVGATRYLIVEAVRRFKGPGRLALYSVNGNEHELITTYQNDGHLSFPCPLVFENKVFFACETGTQTIQILRFDVDDKQISLFLELEFPTRAEDPLLLERDGLIYLLISHGAYSLSIDSPASSLWLYLLGDKLNKKEVIKRWCWKLHAHQRNGGLVSLDGDIFRVYQRAAFNHYGRSIGVNKLNFSGESIDLGPDLGIPTGLLRGKRSVHHLHIKDSLVAVDYEDS